MSGNGRITPSEILDQPARSNPEAEQQTIGSVLLDPSRFDDVSILKPADFHDPRLETIFRHLAAMHGEGAIDTVLLLARLRESGDLERAGGAAYLTEVAQSVAVPSHAAHYAKIVKDTAGLRTFSHLMTEGLRESHSSNSSPSDLIRKFRGELERMENGTRPAGMTCISAAELDRGDYDIEYHVDGIVVAKQPTIWGGWQKTLKTTLLAALAVALVLAQRFLGVFNVPRACRVGFVSCESGLGVLQETFRRICIAYGCSLGDLSGLFISDTIPRLDDPASIVALEYFCTDNELEVLILDPAYLMMSGADAGNLLLMGERLAALNTLSQKTGVTIILAHHLKKTRVAEVHRYSPPQLEEIAWSGFAEFARGWVLLGRQCEYEDGSGFHALWLRAGGSAGHNSLWGVNVTEGLRTDPGGRRWEVEVMPGRDIIQDQVSERTRQQDDRRQREEKAGQKAIIEAMSKLPKGEGVFPAKLRAMTGIANERLQRLLHQLGQAGILKPCSALRSPTHKTPQAGAWRLSEDWWKDE